MFRFSDLSLITKESNQSVCIKYHLPGDSSVLKYCEWKGLTIPCSSIFTTHPTDRGLCCTFNILKAEEIFQGQTYQRAIKELQEKDSAYSFEDKSGSNVMGLGEFKTDPGKNKGLTVFLDAHTDKLSSGSVNEDDFGLIGLVGPKTSFPLSYKGSFLVRPGHNNIVAMSSTVVDSDSGLRDLSDTSRGCRFEDENDGLTIFKNYSQANCFVECFLKHTIKIMKNAYNFTTGCTPWFMPVAEAHPTVCDPWQAAYFLEIMSNIPESNCQQCIPDCIKTTYSTSVTSVPLRKCVTNEFGMSRDCANIVDNMSNVKLIESSVKDSIIKRFGKLPFYIKSNWFAYIRKYGTLLPNGDVYGESLSSYDALQNDIAKVEIFFKSTTTMKVKKNVTMTWIDYFSNVGGILGLVLGIGIISVFELIWLNYRMVSR